MKDTLLKLPELIWPKPNGGQVVSDVVMHTLYFDKFTQPYMSNSTQGEQKLVHFP